MKRIGLLGSVALATGVLLALPVALVVASVFQGAGETWSHLAATALPRYVGNTVLLLVVVFYWQKWGAAALVMVAIALAVCVANGNMGSAAAAVVLILALAPVVLLIVLMTTGKQPTMWSQMD